MILAGDVGGTKTVLAVLDADNSQSSPVRQERFSSSGHPSFETILDKFLNNGDEPIDAACFGVAGVVIDGKSKTTNLPWSIEEASLAERLGTGRVKLLNDLEAAAYGMLVLRGDQIHPLHKPAATDPDSRRGSLAVIAAGTGLGEAMLYWDGKQHHPIASEGGHASFAPQDDQQLALLKYLWSRFGDHASWERVLSGNGIHNIYSFLRDTGSQPEPGWLADRLALGDPNATITEVGVAGDDPVCNEAIRLFCRLYGQEAGNLALKCLASGGIFVAGGIAPHLLPVLDQEFMKGLIHKGRFANMLEGWPVYIALEPRAPMLGAAHYARRLLGT